MLNRSSLTRCAFCPLQDLTRNPQAKMSNGIVATSQSNPSSTRTDLGTTALWIGESFARVCFVSKRFETAEFRSAM